MGHVVSDAAHYPSATQGMSNSGGTPIRVDIALCGDLPIESLTDEESVVFDAEVDARLDAHLLDVDNVDALAALGFSSVAVDDLGRMVEYHPDGTRVVLES